MASAASRSIAVAVAILVAGCQTVPVAPVTAAATEAPDAFVAVGDGGQRHVPTDTVFPATIAGLTLAGTTVKERDSTVTYRGEHGLAVSFSLYRPAALPADAIDRGNKSAAVQREYKTIIAGFADLQRRGAFSDVAYLGAGSSAELPTRSGPLPGYWAIFKYRSAAPARHPMIGHLVVAGYDHRFLKVRISYPDPAVDPHAPRATLEQQTAAHMTIGSDILEITRSILN